MLETDSKYPPRATVLLLSLFDFYISLPSGHSIRVRSSSLSASTSFGCSFFVGKSGPSLTFSSELGEQPPSWMSGIFHINTSSETSSMNSLLLMISGQDP